MEGTPDSKKYKERFNAQAKEQNRYRSLADKIFDNKTTGVEIARKEAEDANKLLDKRTENELSESKQAAADEILEGKEFGGSDPLSKDDRSRIAFQELIRSKEPMLQESIRYGNLMGVRKYLSYIKNNRSDREYETYLKGFRGMVEDAIDTMIRSHDYRGLGTLLTFEQLYDEDLDLISPVFIAQMPLELLSQPDIKQKVLSVFKMYMKQTIDVDPKIQEVLDELTKLA